MVLGCLPHGEVRVPAKGAWGVHKPVDKHRQMCVAVGEEGKGGDKQDGQQGAAAMTAKGTEPQSVVRGGLWGSGELGFEFET